VNPTVAAILQHNAADIKVIVDKIGVETLLALTPNFMRIMATVQAQQTTAKVV
jgi:hypothetical protein